MIQDAEIHVSAFLHKNSIMQCFSVKSHYCLIGKYQEWDGWMTNHEPADCYWRAVSLLDIKLASVKRLPLH